MHTSFRNLSATHRSSFIIHRFLLLLLLPFIVHHSSFIVCLAADPLPSPGSAHTKFFGLEAQGTKFVYVLDRSGSMGDNHETKMKAAKDELLKSLQDLDERQQFYIIFYNETPRLFDPGISKGRLVFATDDNKRHAEQFIAGVHPDGGTNHMAALTGGLAIAPRRDFPAHRRRSKRRSFGRRTETHRRHQRRRGNYQRHPIRPRTPAKQFAG